ncbi:MAG: endo-1,4-beta-xylanase [Acidobacteria bacterium]|nr:endo-1,4-beta-xylanase [Acidobacteriota bacterium]
MPADAGFRLGTRIGNTAVTGAADVHPRIDLRRHIQWSSVEPARNAAYKWAEIDSLVAALKSNNINCLGVISQTPAWASSTGAKGNIYPNPADLPSLYAFVTAAVNRYKATIKEWEVYNECDFRGWTAAQYAQVAIGCSAAIRAADPTATVVTGVSIVPPVTRGGNNSGPWWDALMANAAFKAASDVFSWHLYCKGNPAPPPEIGDKKGAVDDIIPASINRTRAAGFKGEIWITESGWTTDPAGNIDPVTGKAKNLTTDDNQASFLVRMAVMYAALGIDRWYQFQLYGANTGDESGGMGLWNPPRINGGSKKPSWAAYQTACNFLIGATNVTRLASAPGVYLYSLIKADGQSAWCAWTVAGNASVSISGLPATVRRTLRGGTQSTVSTTAGVLTITAGPSPIWVEIV